MKKPAPNPTIRILMLGAPGVGKDCLESRDNQFTTSTYPPPYNPALTLTSRRLFTLTPRPPTPSDALLTRPLDTSDGLKVTLAAAAGGPSVPGSSSSAAGEASSAFSNPASVHSGDGGDDAGIGIGSGGGNSAGRCPQCAREEDEDEAGRTGSGRTYMVELINCPALQDARARAHVLAARGTYDAVLLVYDVCSRDSFDAVADLHGEILPSGSRWHHRRRRNHHRHRRAASAATAEEEKEVVGDKRARGSWFGGGASASSLAVEHSGAHYATRRGEVVVALAGNKADVDMDADGGAAYDKEAALQEAEVEERGLVHPLFRESRLYEHDLPLRRNGGNHFRARVPSSSPLSGPPGGIKRESAPAALLARRSVMSADSVLGGGGIIAADAGVRRSVLSARTVPLSPLMGWGGGHAQRRSEVIERWLRTGSPVPDAVDEEEVVVVERGPAEEEEEEEEAEDDGTRVDAWSDTEAAARRRQVSWEEGDALARALVLGVPFCETSARTGEGVEEVFETVVRAVLREMGREDEGGEVEGWERKRGCRHRGMGAEDGRRECRRGGSARRARSEVVVARESAVSEHLVDGLPKVEVTETPVEGAATTSSSENGEAAVVPLTADRTRRPSVVERMKRVFTRRHHGVVGDVAA